MGQMLLVDVDGAEEAELLRLRGAPLLRVSGSFMQLFVAFDACQGWQICMRLHTVWMQGTVLKFPNCPFES